MRKGGLLILSVAAALVLAGSAAAQTDQPASSPAPPASTAPPAIRLAVKAIREANTVAAAAEGYAEGAEVDRENVELNTAYMRRLLQLGQPQTAGGPATILVQVPVEDGMAFGVVGYNCGRQNDLPNALRYTLKAANLLKDDPSIQNNLGQLTAWYECAKSYKLSAEDQKTLGDLKADLEGKAA